MRTLFRFYYFKVDEFSGLPGPFLCSTINPTGGFAAYYDDSFPPAEDSITQFGCVWWYADGEGPCEWPLPPLGACCYPTGDCVLIGPAVCEAQGGIYQGDTTVCVPDNPCAQPGACCDPANGTCTYVIVSDCPTSFVWHPEWTCDPNYCPLPVPTTPATWGEIKASYR